MNNNMPYCPRSDSLFLSRYKPSTCVELLLAIMRPTMVPFLIDLFLRRRGTWIIWNHTRSQHTGTQGLNLTLAHSQGLNLTLAHSQGLNLTLAHSQGLNLTLAHSQGLNLTLVHSLGLNLTLAHSQGLNLTLAHSQELNLTLAHAQKLT